MSNLLVIEKGIAIPERQTGGKYVDLVRRMEVGDSFAMVNRKAAGGLYSVAHKLNYKLAIRNMPDGTARIWRLS